MDELEKLTLEQRIIRLERAVSIIVLMLDEFAHHSYGVLQTSLFRIKKEVEDILKGE